MEEGRDLIWIGTSLEDLKAFPEEVKDMMGYALHLAQYGQTHIDAKPMRGMGGVFEVAERFNSDTFRAVYTVRLKRAVYVLHAFQKKSKKGIATPARDLELIRHRLAQAMELDNTADDGGAS